MGSLHPPALPPPFKVPAGSDTSLPSRRSITKATHPSLVPRPSVPAASSSQSCSPSSASFPARPPPRTPHAEIWSPHKPPVPLPCWDLVTWPLLRTPHVPAGPHPSLPSLQPPQPPQPPLAPLPFTVSPRAPILPLPPLPPTAFSCLSLSPRPPTSPAANAPAWLPGALPSLLQARLLASA